LFPGSKVVVKIELRDRSTHRAESIIKALIPDNVEVPKGLSINMNTRGPKITITLTANGIGVPALLGTLDEILEHVSVAEKVIG